MLDGFLTPLEIEALGGQNILTVVYDVYITRWFSAIALTLVCYDNLLTFSDEVNFIWPKRWSAIKILIHLNRLVSLCFISLNTYTLIGARGPISDRSCEVILVSTGYGAYLSFSMCNWILLARTKAVLCHRPLGNRLLLAFYIVSYSITGILVTHTSVTLHGKIFYSPALDACGIAMRPSTMGFIWLAPLIFETTTFVLTIRKLYKNAAEEYTVYSKLITTLYRDGVCYYLVIIGLRIFNLLAWLVMPVQFALIGIFLLWAVMSISVTRLQINLIEAAQPLLLTIEISSVGPSISVFAASALSHQSDQPQGSNSSNMPRRSSRVQLRTFTETVTSEP